MDGGGVRPVYQPGPLSLLTFLLCTLTAVQCHANPDLVNKRSQHNVFRLRTNVRPQRNRGMLPNFCNRARGNKVFHFQKVWQPTPWPADVWNTLPHTPPHRLPNGLQHGHKVWVRAPKHAIKHVYQLPASESKAVKDGWCADDEDVSFF